MPVSQFPQFVFKEKVLLCQAGNYKLLTPTNAETDADLIQHLRKTGTKSVPLLPKHCPVCSDVLCSPVPEEAMPTQLPLLRACPGGTQGCSPHWRCPPSKRGHDMVDILLEYFAACNTEKTPCSSSSAPW